MDPWTVTREIFDLLQYNVCDNISYVGKAKKRSISGLITLKVNVGLLNENRMSHKKFFMQNYAQDCYTAIDDWEVILSAKCETHKQLKGRETFWQYKLKSFYPLGLSVKKNICFNHAWYIRSLGFIYSWRTDFLSSKHFFKKFVLSSKQFCL